MNDFRDDSAGLPALNPEDLERDRRFEVILDECVASSPVPGPELTARILEARPFAPWEVRRARSWRMPAAAALSLLAASLAVFLAPLWSLGPATAADLWVRVIAASASGAAAAVFSAAPLLVEKAGPALAAAPGLKPGLAGLLFLSGGTLALVARRLAKRPVRASARA